MDPAFYALCDELGLLVMDESFDTWTASKPGGAYAYNLYFNQWWAEDTRAMVMRDRNHPSVVIYSAGNEIHDPLNTEVGRQRFLMQRDLMHKLDPSRPVTLALFRPNAMQLFDNGFVELMDVVGTNYRDAELIAAHEAKPERKILATENNHDNKAWLSMRDTPAHAGQFLWTGIEYLGEAMRWPNIGWGTALLDRNAYWRPLGYQRQSWWGTKPMVKMIRKEDNSGAGADVIDWTPVDFGTYDIARVLVYSNCDEVELFLNGTSKGKLPINADESPRVWNIDFEPGTIKAVAYNKGQQVATDEMKTADAPVKVQLTAEKSSVQNTWEDVVYVKATVVDKNGERNPNVTPKLTFTLSGPGVLTAVDNGSTTAHESYKSNERTANKGEAVAIIQATANSGKITLSVSADGLESSTVTIDAVPVK
jgi:beta-galactosidase